MRILVACEFSGVVREAFNAYSGFHAVSCDILPPEDGRTDYHMQCDVLTILNDDCWDAVIAFPPCTHLAVSGAKHFAEKRADGGQAEGIQFFMALINAPARFVAVENPIGIMSTEYRKPDQIIHPWQFGHPEQKSTCLWLKNLPKLTPTNYVKSEMMALPKNKRERLHYLPPSKTRAMERSRTFSGIAQAMAAQWTNYLISQ